jgi:ribosomal protein S18 acetylase RimI-like enzyme
LLLDLLEIGRSRGWRTVFWHVRADNAVARALYDQHGVEEGYVRYRTPTLASAKGG